MTALRTVAWVALAAVAAALGSLVDGPAGVVLAILLGTMVLWVGEVLPLAATALLSSLALILVAGYSPGTVFASYFDPVVVLLLGGFFLGVALRKHGLDVYLADLVVRRAGTDPKWVLLAVMGATATFSMWISNTAATAIMLPIALGVAGIRDDRPGGNLAKVLVLGVAFSANVGGIATPIGTTPNPIALRFLADAGHSVTFLGWMVRMVPLVAAMVVAVWAILLRVYPVRDVRLDERPPLGHITRPQAWLVGVFALTVVLWLTTDIHGVPASVIALVPIVLLFVTRLLAESDIHDVGWPTLLLIGGGIALGEAVVASGLDSVFADAIRSVVTGQGFVAFLVVAAAALLLTVAASNTAAAVIMIPIVIQLGLGWGVPVQPLVMMTAAVLSLDFLVPVGTPPNAMAYGTGHVNVAQMAKAGVWASLAGVLIAASLAYWLW